MTTLPTPSSARGRAPPVVSKRYSGNVETSAMVRADFLWVDLPREHRCIERRGLKIHDHPVAEPSSRRRSSTSAFRPSGFQLQLQSVFFSKVRTVTSSSDAADLLRNMQASDPPLGSSLRPMNPSVACPHAGKR